MKKSLLTLVITLVGMICSQRAGAYTVTDLTNAGWTQVTSLNQLRENSGDYYFVFVDAASSNYAMANPNPGSGLKPAYQTLQDPAYITHELWTLNVTQQNRTTIRSYSDNYYFSSGTAGWNDNMVNATNGNQTNFTVTYANNKFTLQSRQTNQYVGPWNNSNAVNLAYNDNQDYSTDPAYEAIAANKAANQAPGFLIYRKEKTQFSPVNHTALGNLGWTQVTSAADLGKPGFCYTLLDVSERGFESGYVVTGGINGHPKSKVQTATTTNDPSAAQQWTMVQKGTGYALQNMEDGKYLYCNGATWNTGFTDNYNANSTEFRFAYDADGRWTLSNTINTNQFLGRWADLANHTYDGEDIACNKAANAGKKFYYIYAKQLNAPQRKLFGFLKKAKALNSILNKAELTTEIQTAQSNLLSYTPAQIETEIAVIQGLWMAEMDSSTPMITVTNGTFDNGINIGTDGVNTATFIAPATAAKPYIYPVQGWTPDFTFANTASQGNTSHYGVTVANDGNNGTNSTNPPSSDMFGGTDGGVLHTSAGWNNISRYYQNLPTLDAGRYILYYEANNQNNTANTIQTSYFGISNATPAKYSTLMTYPYNEWMASATEFIFFDEQSSARLNVGVTGTTGGSASGAKLWVDNVELYHLKWDVTSAAQALQERINNIDKSQYMNESVCQNLVDVIAAAQAVVNDNSHTLAQINDAQQTLTIALSEAEASIEVYRTIKARLDLLNNAAQRGSISEANFTALPFYQKYSNGSATLTSAGWHVGSYETLNEVIPEYRRSITKYWTVDHTPAANNDLSAFIVNQGFEFGDATGWTGGNDGGEMRVAGLATNRNWQQWNANYNLSQKLEGMPAGTYELKVQGFYRPGALNNASTDQNLIIYAGNAFTQGAVLLYSGGVNAQDNGNGYSGECTNQTPARWVPNSQDDASRVLTTGKYENTLTILVGPEGVTIGGKKTTLIGNDWSVLDNFRLIFKSSNMTGTWPALTPVDGDLMRKVVYDEQAAAKTAYQASATAGTYARYAQAIADATISHAAYVLADEAVKRVENMLDNTNVYTYDAYVKFYNIYNTFKAPFDARTLADNLAEQMEYQIFGNGSGRQTGVPVVEFLGSAWDDNGDYTWGADPADNYWVNTWSTEGNTDGSQMKTPFMEYWRPAGTGLANKILTATVKAVPESQNNVRALVRVLTTGGAPTGITMRVYSDDRGGGHTTTNCANPSWTRIGNTNYYYTTMTVTSGKADYDSDTDGFGDLRIQFVVNGTNVSWLAFKNVWVDYKDINGNAITTNWTDVDNAITDGESKRLGFWGGEYAPYTNVKTLQALEALKAYKAAHDHHERINEVLVNNALYTYTHPGWIVNPGEDWDDNKTPEENLNAKEMNAVSWRTNYTKDEIIPAYDYDENGNISYTFQTIAPDGWDLNGRANGYDTRIMKFGVNTQGVGGDVGAFANCDSIALFFKRDTKYGEQLGYTMPLKPGTKYSLTFTYTNWARDLAESQSFYDNNTEIIIREKDAPYTRCPIYYSDDDSELISVSQGGEMDIDMGNFNATKWKAVRAYFTTPNIYVDNDGDGEGDNIDMVIEFSKSIKDRQIQMAIGELYILKYRDQITLAVDGQNTNTGTAANNYTDNFKINTDVKACNITLTRTLKRGQWNSLCLPVKVPYKDMRRLFQVNGKPAIDKVFIYTGTTRSGIYEVLNFTSRQGGIQAGQPVLVKPYNDTDGRDVDGDLVINQLLMKNYVVKNEEPVQKDPNGIYDFVGVYEVYNVKQYDIYTKHNATTGEDELIKKVTDDKKTWLQPTRAYFKDVSVQSGRYDAPGMVKLWGFNLDDVETGIMAVEPDGTMTVTSGNIYDLNGRMVRQNATNLEGLRPGIYVVDGRKVMVR